MAEENEKRREEDGRDGDSRAAHRDERRQSLVLAAYQLIAEKGFEHLRTRDVAARACVNIATLHYYFVSKEDLIRGVVDHLLTEFSGAPPMAVQQAIDDITPIGQVRGMFLETYYRFQAMPEMFIVLSELVMRSLRDASLQPALQHLDEGWHAYLQHLVLDGVRQGAFRADIDAESMASGLIVLMKGFFFHQITSPGSVNIIQVLDDVERLLLP
jgi:AcrR family transcriptional regulator